MAQRKQPPHAVLSLSPNNPFLTGCLGKNAPRDTKNEPIRALSSHRFKVANDEPSSNSRQIQAPSLRRLRCRAEVQGGGSWPVEAAFPPTLQIEMYPRSPVFDIECMLIMLGLFFRLLGCCVANLVTLTSPLFPQHYVTAPAETLRSRDSLRHFSLIEGSPLERGTCSIDSFIIFSGGLCG